MAEINTILMSRLDRITRDEAIDILQRAELGEFNSRVSLRIPAMPKGGDLFLYKKKKSNDVDYRSDQYTWRNLGRNKKDAALMKTYFKVTGADWKTVVEGFCKTEHELKEPIDKNHAFVLIQYSGDAAVVDARFHGNSKRPRIYVRTTKSRLDDMRNDAQRLESQPKSIYQENLRKSRSEHVGEDYSKFESAVGPKNIKQVKNLRQSEKLKRMLLRDELFSILEMAQGDLHDFVKKYSYTPDGSVIILGSSQCIELANKLLKECNGKPEQLGQLITYDTTFECGDIYISPLIMRNTFLADDPIFPVLFLLHDRKKQWQHEEFFRTAVNELKLFEHATHIPIATDREKAITNAIKNVYSQANHVFCQNHILRDAEFWIKQQKDYTSDDIKGLKHNVRQLLECEDEISFDDLYNNMKSKWTPSFLLYFEKNLCTDIQTKGAAFNVKKYKAFRNVKATNNLSESFNKVMKEAMHNKELPLDSLVLVLYQMQNSYCNEFNRGMKNIGQYEVKDNYENIPEIELGPLAHLTSSELVDCLKKTVDNAPLAIEKSANYRATSKTLAKLIIDKDLLSIDSKSKSYIVRSPYGEERYVIWKHNDRYVCSCRSTGLCSHIIAILMFNDIEIPEGSDDKCTYKLSVLLKRKRGREGKSGRKRPRTKDIDVTIVEADDSLAAKGNTGSFPLTSTPKDKSNLKGKKSRKGSPGGGREGKVENDDKNRKMRNSGDDLDITSFDYPEGFELNENEEDESLKHLAPKEDIGGFAIDDMLNSVVKEKNLGSQVLYLSTMTQSALGYDNYEIVLNELGTHQAYNKDYILIVLNTDTKGKGSHWVLGMVAFNEKQIIVFDSLVYAKSDTRIPLYKQLASLAMFSSYIADIEFEFSSWTFNFSTDCPKQPNGFDCGLFTTVLATCIMGNKEYVTLESDRGRRWMAFNLIQRAQPVLPNAPAVAFKATRQLLDKCINGVKALCGSFNIVERNTQLMTIDIVSEKQGWTMCAASNSCNIDASHAEQHDIVMCAKCRLWYHATCVQETVTSVTYYICYRCQRSTELKVTDIANLRVILPDVSRGIEYLIINKKKLRSVCFLPDVAIMSANDVEALMTLQQEESEDPEVAHKDQEESEEHEIPRNPLLEGTMFKFTHFDDFSDFIKTVREEMGLHINAEFLTADDISKLMKADILRISSGL